MRLERQLDTELGEVESITAGWTEAGDRFLLFGVLCEGSRSAAWICVFRDGKLQQQEVSLDSAPAPSPLPLPLPLPLLPPRGAEGG